MESNPSIRAVERALDELRRGYPVVLRHAGSTLKVKAAECEDAGAKGPLKLVISPQRAQHLKLAAGAQCMTLSVPAGQEAVLEELLYAPHAQTDVLAAPASAAETLAVELVKQAGLIPAALVQETQSAEKDLLEISGHDMEAYRARPVRLKLDNIVHLPIAAYEDTRLAVFEEQGGFSHLAILIGNPEEAQAPLARVHSSCFTGDILGSLRCDCGNQLQDAIAAMAEAGSGILLYLNQEGRGIGLVNKLRAYRLQEEGLDTVDANLALGFGEDERDFAVAAQMLRVLGISTIRLLTNNPHKQEVLAHAGITVAERVPLRVQPGKHNRDYLETKEKRLGHQH